jgi:hypothetical protein
MKKLFVFLSATLLVLGTVGAAAALTINNFNFDSPGVGSTGWSTIPPLGWGSDPIGIFGVYNPIDYETLPARETYIGHDGSDVALVFGNGRVGVWLAASPANIPTDGMTYTLSVRAAGRIDLYVDATYQLRLIAGTSDTKEWIELDISDPFTPVAGEFQEATFIYTASSLDPKYSRLGINLVVSGAGSGGQILFDDVRLDASPAVPEPATMLLLGSGLIGVGAFVRRKFKK